MFEFKKCKNLNKNEGLDKIKLKLKVIKVQEHKKNTFIDKDYVKRD